MSQIFAIVAGLLAIATIVAIPVTLLTVYKRRRARAYAELAGWAQRRGLAPSRVSALPRSLVPYVSALHYELDGGALSVNIAEGRSRAYVTFYYRPRAGTPGGDFSLQRRTFGAAGRPATGDAEFDRRFLVSAHGDAAWRGLLRPEVRAALVQQSDEAWSLGRHDGALIYVQEGELVDPEARERALVMLRLVASGPAPQVGG